MSALKASLKSAKESLSRSDPKSALQHCKAALKVDKSSYEAYLLIGKSAFLLGEHGQSALAYKKAREINGTLLPAWKGLVELYTASQDHAQLADALQHLLPLSEASEGKERQNEIRRKLAEAFQKMGQPDKALDIMGKYLETLEDSDPAVLDALCKVADLQVGQALADAGARREVLNRIVKRTAPDAQYADYHEAWFTARFADLPGYSASSNAWLTARQELLHDCLDLVACAPEPQSSKRSVQGSICTWAPYESASALIEQLTANGEGKLADRQGRLMEHAALERLMLHYMHKFPWRPAARGFLALALQKQYTSANEASSMKERSRVIKTLSIEALEAGHSCRAWVIAAEVNLQNGQHKTATDICFRGLDWLKRQDDAGHPPQEEDRSRLRLAQAEEQLVGQQLSAAEGTFRSLAEETKAVKNVAWAARQRVVALKGLAACALARKDLHAANTLYKYLLSQGTHSISGGMIGQIQADYGWALFLGDELQEARLQLEEGLSGLQQAGGAVTDCQLGEAHYRLGRVDWAVGDHFRTDRQHAHKHFLAAAALEGPFQGTAFAWLGSFYSEVAGDVGRAQRCSQRALALDPQQEVAGEGLCKMLQQSGEGEKALKLCQDVTSRSPSALWAWSRLGRLLLRAGNHQQAVGALQTGLRGESKNADAWEALGLAYQSLGHLTAAIKAYARATSLDTGRLFCWVQSGTIQLCLGAAAEALASFETALAAAPLHLPALMGAAEALLAAARHHISFGALGLAAKELHGAERRAVQACARSSRLRATWKLLGDIRLTYHCVDPYCTAQDAEPAQSEVDHQLKRWQERVRKVHSAGAAYAKALHLAPQVGSLWGDMGAACFQEAQLLCAHPALDSFGALRLRRQAERLVRAGLRLEPVSPALWLALGCAASEPAVREYALSRALQLDPKQVTAWTALGRLYTESGEVSLAGRCFANARSHEPTAAIIWEGMGALSALSATGERDRGDCYEHATRLVPGKEALLGYVEATLKQGLGHQAPVHAAACRAVAWDPLNPAAHAALALVRESRGDLERAATGFRRTLSLLDTIHRQGQEQPRQGVSAAAAANGTAEHEEIRPLCLPHLAAKDSDLDLSSATQVNLARVLAKAGLSKEAADVFKKLDFMQRLANKPAALLAYGQSLLGMGNVTAARTTFQSSLDAHPEPQVYAEVVTALCRLEIAQGRLSAAKEVLDRHMQALMDSKAPSEAVQNALLTLLAGAASHCSGQALAAVRLMCARYSAAIDDIGGATFVAAQISTESRAASLQGKPLQAGRLAARALHLCPWQAILVAEAGTACLLANNSVAMSARHACSSPALRHLHRSAASVSASSDDAPQADAVRKGHKVRAYAVLTQPPGLQAEPELQHELKALLHWVHTEPYNAEAWIFASLASLQLAQCQPSEAAFRRAIYLLEGAEAACRRFPQPKSEELILSALAEAHVQMSALARDNRASTAKAKAAVSRAASIAGPGNDVATVCALQQARLLDLEGKPAEADAAFQRAVDQASSEDKAAVAFCFGQAVLHSAMETANTQRIATALASLDAAVEQLPKQPKQTFLAAVLCAKAVLLLLQDKVVAAKVAAETALSASKQSCTDFAMPTTCLTAQVVLALVLLAEARQGGPTVQAALSKARRCLSPAVEGRWKQAAVLGHTLLAEVESLGTHRKREERVDEHIRQVMQMQNTRYLLARLAPLLHNAGQPVPDA